MTRVARVLAPAALVATLAAPLLLCAGAMGESAMKQMLLLATVAWFVAAPRWLRGGGS
jgi:hypothetical protein